MTTKIVNYYKGTLFPIFPSNYIGNHLEEEEAKFN